MGSPTTDGAGLESHSVAVRPLPEFVDWLLAVLIALAGLALLVGGTALAFVVDRSMLAAGIANGDLNSGTLTDAELLEIALAVVNWVGFGLILTGLAMVLGAVWYVVVRHRAHRNAGDGEPVDSYGANAVIGAVTTVFVSFLPFSPAIGGGLAGYLERGQSERTISVGALSGLLAAAPLLAIMVFLTGGLVSGLLAIEAGGIALVVGAAMLLGSMVVATVSAGLGAVGGYVGGILAERRVAS